MVTVSAIGPGAGQALILERTIRLQLQWADPSRKWRLLLTIDTRTDLRLTRAALWFAIAGKRSPSGERLALPIHRSLVFGRRASY